MRDDLDHKMNVLLAGWQAPAPSQDAVARLLYAAAAVPMPNAQPVLRRWRNVYIAGPAVAAALALGVMTIGQQETLPKNEPILAQSALNVFSINDRNVEAEALP